MVKWLGSFVLIGSIAIGGCCRASKDETKVDDATPTKKTTEEKGLFSPPICPYVIAEKAAVDKIAYQGPCWWGGTMMTTVAIYVGERQLSKPEARKVIVDAITTEINNRGAFVFDSDAALEDDDMLIRRKDDPREGMFTEEPLDIVRVTMFKEHLDDPFAYFLEWSTNENFVAAADWRSPKLGDEGQSPVPRCGEEEIWEDENVKVYWSKSYFE